MNDRNLDQLLNAWMDLGPTTAPDRVADAARLEARSTRQTAIRQWWPPRRFPQMNNMAELGLAAAAVVVAALLGYSLSRRPEHRAGPGQATRRRRPQPTPSPSAAQTL